MAACELCHPTAAKDERAGLPKVDLCMACHQTVRADRPAIQRLASFQKAPQLLAWVRVYKAPDYVFFHHGRHAGAKIDCTACHGPVARRDVLKRERPIAMKFCVDCHRSRNASVACNLCHELGQ